MINYFDSIDLSYNKIKELQSVLEDQYRIEEFSTPSMNDVNVNVNVYNIIRSIYEGLVNRNQGRINMNNEIDQVIVDIRADIRRIQEGNTGGRRRMRKSRRTRRTKGKKTKRRRTRGSKK